VVVVDDEDHRARGIRCFGDGTPKRTGPSAVQQGLPLRATGAAAVVRYGRSSGARRLPPAAAAPLPAPAVAAAIVQQAARDLRPGMESPVHVPQVLAVHVRVDLR